MDRTSRAAVPVDADNVSGVVLASTTSSLQMSDRAIAIVGIGIGLLGIGVQILFPDADKVGWACIALGIALLLAAWVVHQREARTPLSASLTKRQPQLQPDPPAQTRPFVELTPAQLVKFFDGRTQIQAAQLWQAYAGKWIRVQGELKTCKGFEKRIVAGLRVEGATVSCWFSPSWKPHLEHRAIGSTLTVVGQLAECDSWILNLDNSELEGTVIDGGTWAPPPTR